MKNILNTIIILIIQFLIAGTAFTQIPITVFSNIDSTLTGYEIPLEIRIPENINANFFKLEVLDFVGIAKIYSDRYDLGIEKSQIDSIEMTEVDFEIIDFGNWKGEDNTIHFNDKNINNPNKITIKIWDTGQFTILPVAFKDSSGIMIPEYPDLSDNYKSIVILSSTSPIDSLSQNLEAIKDIIKEEKTLEDYIVWILIVLGLIVVTLAIMFLPKFMKKKNLVVEEINEKEQIPAHIVAFKKLHKLKSEKIWKKGQIKEFQTQLTYTLREYLEKRYNTKALEQTTGEIAHSLTKHSLKEKDIQSLKNILQIADLVKFAKAKPNEDIHEQFLNDTIEFVKMTKEDTVT